MIGVNDLKTDMTSADKAVTEFRQSYTSASYSELVSKRMEWIREGNRWKIQREQMLEAPKASVPSLMKPGTKRNASISSQACVCDQWPGEAGRPGHEKPRVSAIKRQAAGNSLKLRPA